MKERKSRLTNEIIIYKKKKPHKYLGTTINNELLMNRLTED